MIKFINLVLFAGMLVMNYLANALPLNNKTTRELSDSLPNLFVPAGIIFSIWGVIYLLLIIFCAIQFTGSDKETLTNIRWLFGLSCVLNTLWILFWHYGKLHMSLLVMLGLLISLIYVNILIRVLPHGIIKATFGIYLGWICIATIANVTALLVHSGWNGFNISDEIWTIIMIFTGTLIVVLAIFRFQNPFIGLSVIWAFIGIAIKRQDDYKSVFISALVALSLISLVTIWGFFKKI